MLLKKSIIAIGLLCLLAPVFSQAPDPDPLRFKQEIDAFLQWDRKNSAPDDAILFVGSSSIRMWETHDAFPDRPVINRGFGGAHISDLAYYYEQIIAPYDADIIVFYCGDNDVAGGKSVTQVFEDYKDLAGRILQDKPGIKLTYLPIKPSMARWTLWETMREVNEQISDYNKQNEQLLVLDTATPLLRDAQPDTSLFQDDGLHLNEAGYRIWDRLLSELLWSFGDHSGIISPADPEFQYTGRIDFSDPAEPVLFWPGSTIRARFEGTSLQIVMDDSTGDNYYNVMIDGHTDDPVILDCLPGIHSYSIADNLENTIHELWIFRRTEGFSGPTRFLGLVLDEGGTLSKPPARPGRKIEFYGNSITCGMGNEVPDNEEDEQNDKRNNFLAYGAITARNLNADYTCIAKSGIGIMISWFDMVMPQYYNRLNPWDPESRWDFTLWTPDVVVINLFQNDSWLIGRLDPVPGEEKIILAYTDFIRTLRSVYPDALFICALGSMDATKAGSPWPGYVQNAVDRWKNETGDQMIETCFFEFDGFYKHPRVRHHRVMAEKLTRLIRSKMGW
jgi:lysophospholipase L1-like esterase